MWARRFTTLLCASAVLATTAAADEGAPFVTQLRLPARDRAIDVFAFRGASGVAVDAAALDVLGIVAPASEGPIPLSSVPGLTYDEPAGEAAIVITCTMACYSAQHIDLRDAEEHAIEASASGGYINYEADAQWVDRDGVRLSGIAEGALFGRWGLLQSSWIGQTYQSESRLTRLETTWTIDAPRAGVRSRIGDSVLIGANGAPVRFGGIQIGRYFGLTPSMITYPTPALTGEAATASTVELYVDGALRAQGEVAAGPFVIDQAPIVSGAGEAELVITDLLGRQQTITRPFVVNTSMLRAGLDDWSFALGAERRSFGRESARYGDTFVAGRYRRGATDALTLEAAFEATDDIATAQAGATIAMIGIGQAYLSQAQNDDGGFTTASWMYDGRAWTVGAQFEQRQGDFRALGADGDNAFRQGLAANVAIDLAQYGAFSFTAAEVKFDDDLPARTISLSYTPDFADGALAFRVLHTERDESELSAGVSLSFALGDDISGHVSADGDDRGMTYRGSAQQSPTRDRLGWRARASTGAIDRADIAALARTSLGDTMAQAAVVNGTGGLRLRHAGSVGWIESIPFAGRSIDGAFALVDTGAPNVSVTRNRLDVGESGRDGRTLVTNLRPYGANVIGISADDLPLDRAPASPTRQVTPRQGAGVVVHFADAHQSLTNTRVLFADATPPPRGSMLVRRRDGERFPVGSHGRVVLQGARDGDIVELENASCIARADPAAAETGLELVCTAAA